MKQNPFAGLEPAAVWNYFSQVCEIPHGSGHCEAISKYLTAFAESHGLRNIRDEHNNVVIFAPATPGYEDHEPVILQGHMDMVCQKDADCNIDMAAQPIRPVREGDLIRAEGTTLGADDGIAVALFLAVLADPAVAHPPLEVVFTADEETGLLGATAMDMSMLKGRRMLNVDTFREGVFIAGSAGGAIVTMERPVERERLVTDRVRIRVSGFQGGHSSVAVTPDYANANLVMAQILEQLDCRLISYAGGTASNAVPRECVCEVAGADGKRVSALCEQVLENVKKTANEPQAACEVESLPPAPVEVLTEGDTRQVIRALNKLPNGVLSYMQPGLPQTSLNLGVANLTHRLQLICYLRSSVNAQRDELRQILAEFAKNHGFSHSESGVYGAWEFAETSPLRQTMANIYREKYGKDPAVVVIHAGLEGGIFSEKLPGLDCVSTGPNAHEVHTTRERMEIASMERFWNYLKDVLKAL